MVYSGSHLTENPQSYGAAKLKGMGIFKTGAISGRFATFFWVRYLIGREDKRKATFDNLPTGARTDDLVLQNPARYCLSHAVPSTRPDYLSNIPP